MAIHPTDTHIILRYHYIEDPSPTWKGIHPCSPEKLEKQLEWLSEHYEIVSLQNLYDASRSENKKKCAAVTFDNGYFDQFENAVPILQEYGAPATFFVITSTFDGRVPPAHKMQVLISRADIFQLIEHFHHMLRKEYPEKADVFNIPIDIRLSEERKLLDEIPVANFKEMMSMIPPDMRDVFLDQMFRHYWLEEREISEELFMYPREIKGLAEEGFLIGTHGHSSELYGNMTEEESVHDIHTAKRVLHDILGDLPKYFAYPHSHGENDLSRILKQEGFVLGLTAERAAVTRNTSPYSIPRYDSADIPA